MSGFMEIYLPASDPDNFGYGRVPSVPAIDGNSIFRVVFPKEVWYNREWRSRTVDQLKPALCKNKANILVGFSKSGLGALNIAIENPSLFHSVIIFDAPLTHRILPPWNTSPFYSQSEWENDLPENRLEEVRKLSLNTKIIHVGGASFPQDHVEFDRMLEEHGIERHFQPRPTLAHSWESGWVREAVEMAATSKALRS